jgi:hypothetical protein
MHYAPHAACPPDLPGRICAPLCGVRCAITLPGSIALRAGVSRRGNRDVLVASASIRVFAGPAVGHVADRLRRHTLTVCACALVAAVAGLGYVMIGHPLDCGGVHQLASHLENGAGVARIDSLQNGAVMSDVRAPVTIPSPSGETSASTRQVFNSFASSGGAFMLSNGQPATFLFATEDETIAGRKDRCHGRPTALFSALTWRFKRRMESNRRRHRPSPHR